MYTGLLIPALEPCKLVYRHLLISDTKKNGIYATDVLHRRLLADSVIPRSGMR